MRTAPRLALPVLLLAAAACGDDAGGPDGESLAEAFGEAAAEAYEAEGRDRDEDFAMGIRIDEGCVGFDGDAAEAILAATYAVDAPDDEEAEAGGGFVQGAPGEAEIATCSLQHGEARMGAAVGTTLRDLEQQEAAMRRGSMPDAERLDVDVDGLPSDEVLILADDEMEFLSAAWISDGFFVSVNARLGDTEPERAAAALQVAVGRVAEELDG